MSYETDTMKQLAREMRNLDSLKIALQTFNDNIYIFKSLAEQMQKANDLKEQELTFWANQSQIQNKVLKPQGTFISK